MAVGEASPLVDMKTIQVHQDADVTKPSLFNSFFSSPKPIPERTLSGLLRSTLHFLTPEWHSNDAESVSTPGQSVNTIDNSMEDKGRKPGTPGTLRRIRRQSHLRTLGEERSLLLRTPSPMEFLSPLDLQILDFPTPYSCSTASSIQIVGTQPSLYGSVHDRLSIDVLVEVFPHIFQHLKRQILAQRSWSLPLLESSCRHAYLAISNCFPSAV